MAQDKVFNQGVANKADANLVFHASLNTLLMAAPRFIVHLTKSGERWDLLGWKYYGDATNYRPVIMANPGVAIEPVFDAGLIIVVPMLEQTALEAEDLPPWRTDPGG